MHKAPPEFLSNNEPTIDPIVTIHENIEPTGETSRSISFHTLEAFDFYLVATSDIPNDFQIASESLNSRTLYEIVNGINPAPTAFQAATIKGATSQQDLQQDKQTSLTPPCPDPLLAQAIAEAKQRGAVEQKQRELTNSPNIDSGPLETSEDCAQPYPSLEKLVEMESPNYLWALGQFRKHVANLEHANRYAEDGNAARVICAMLEDPDVLEHSELYRQRMAAISSATLGYASKKGYSKYVTPSFSDTWDLYRKYTEYVEHCQALQTQLAEIRHERDEALRLLSVEQNKVCGLIREISALKSKIESLSIDPQAGAVEAVAEVYQRQAEESADRTIAQLQKQNADLKAQLNNITRMLK